MIGHPDCPAGLSRAEPACHPVRSTKHPLGRGSASPDNKLSRLRDRKIYIVSELLNIIRVVRLIAARYCHIYFWCLARDSNPEHLAPEASASANCASEACAGGW